MKLSLSIDLVMQSAGYEAVAADFGEIEPDHLLIGLLKSAELPMGRLRQMGPEEIGIQAVADEIQSLRSELAKWGIDSQSVRRSLRAAIGEGDTPYEGQPLHRSAATMAVFEAASVLAGQRGADTVQLRHLFEALLHSPTRTMREVLGSKLDRMVAGLGEAQTEWIGRPRAIPKPAARVVAGVKDLTERLRQLRSDLLDKVYGQDHAVHAFVDGLFGAEIVAAADRDRKVPQAVFVFAGPPGVGKTHLATLGAPALDRPFMRFDMSAFAPQNLVRWVQSHPNGVLLFDEIEKAPLEVIHLFLQILDAGALGHRQKVAFRDTIVIFTTNAGRQLYESPNSTGLHASNASFHRRTVLDALRTETNPRTGQPFFPAAIVSRLATGYPILFNHLGVSELDRVARSELDRMAALFQLQYAKKMEFEDVVSMCLVLREGGRVDARTVRAQVESYVKTELFSFLRMFKTDRLDEVFGQFDSVRFLLDPSSGELESEARAFLSARERPRILIIAAAELAALYEDHLGGARWFTATTGEDALEILANEDVDLVLLDVWLGAWRRCPSATIEHLDHVPAAARGVRHGLEALRRIRERLPEIPVYVLSLYEEDATGREVGTIDEELFLDCVRSGGARGLLGSRFVDDMRDGWNEHRERLSADLAQITLRLHREKTAARLGQERKALCFGSAPKLDPETREVQIRLRNLRLVQALAAEDASEVLAEVDRPHTVFEDVIGADEAKKELQYFIDYLKNPRRPAAMGLKPPKGVLLHGPPGTGKTMLARAMAGESGVAFVQTSASSFVTGYQGSGPQNIRDLFERARRYAPAIVFIDEIDAIGKARTGGGKAEENTLNALLTEMEGFSGPSVNRPVFVLAATNFDVHEDDDDTDDVPGESRSLDPALIRRFSRTILVDLPDKDARLKYLRLRLVDRPACIVEEETILLIAERSAGMSIANLENVLETAGRNAVRLGSELTGELLEEALAAQRVFGDAERPTTTFDDIIGADAAKQELQFFIDYLKDPSPFVAMGLGAQKGILLHGPPGTGKTMLARAMAGESNCTFIESTGTSLKSRWHGGDARNVRKVFARARRRAPAIVFIDEIDGIGKERTGGEETWQSEGLNALLTEIDGFSGPSPDKPVLLMAATNFNVEDDTAGGQAKDPRRLDPALVRRFSRKVLIDLPELAARRKYLEMRLGKIPACNVSEAIISTLATRSHRMNLGDLGSVIDAAARNAMLSGGELTGDLLDEALDLIKHGERRAWDRTLVERVARHEAGHTVMYWLSGWWADYVTIVARGGHGGYMHASLTEVESRRLRTKKQILTRIRTSLGGRGAEIVYYGAEDGLSSGASADLENATGEAQMLVSRYGMDDEFGMGVTESCGVEPVNRILRQEMDQTLELLKVNRPHLDAVSGALIAKERLTGEDLQQILPPIPGEDSAMNGGTPDV